MADRTSAGAPGSRMGQSGDPEPSERRPHRWTDSPLPAYAYVPGRTPHPHRSPAGHSFGRAPLRAPRLGPERWREDSAWLLGVDLWNAGYFWEAHEAWESGWNAHGRTGEQASFLQALIQAAAAHVKAAADEPAGVQALWTRALVTLQPWCSPAQVRYMGLDVGDFAGRQSAWIAAWLVWRVEKRTEAVAELPFLRLADDAPPVLTGRAAT